MTAEIQEYKEFIVKKLYHYNCFGAKHTDIENLKKGLAGHLKGNIRPAAKELIKEQILLLKISSYELHVSLNPHKRKEMDKYLIEKE